MSKVGTAIDRHMTEAMASLTRESTRSDIDALIAALASHTLMSLNFKIAGYGFARSIAATLSRQEIAHACLVGLLCKPSVQADLGSASAIHWMALLRVPLVVHRKLWEIACILWAVYEEGHLRSHKRGSGFGCGSEPPPGYLVSRGAATIMTDRVPETAGELGWSDANQHTTMRNVAFHSILVHHVFDDNASLLYVNINAIPDDVSDFVFWWSICALEHFGGIRSGLCFVKEPLRTPRPGGLSVHATERNISSEGPTIDDWPTLLFQCRHREAMAARLPAQGHYFAELDFFLGDQPMDRFVDLPPIHDLPADIGGLLGDRLHMTVTVGSFASTCFGLHVRKAA